MRLEQLKPDQKVYDCHKQRMGNTTMTRMGTWTVKIVSVDLEKRGVYASWNGNPVQWYPERAVKKWRVNPPKHREQ